MRVVAEALPRVDVVHAAAHPRAAPAPDAAAAPAATVTAAAVVFATAHASLAVPLAPLFALAPAAEPTVYPPTAAGAVRVKVPQCRIAAASSAASEREDAMSLVDDSAMSLGGDSLSELGGAFSVPALPAKASVLHCRGCGARLTSEQGFRRVFSLPSPNWLELSDLWTCEAGSFSGFPRKEIEAREGALMVGHTFLLLHEDDLVAGTLTGSAGSGTETIRDAQTRPLACAECAMPMGHQDLNSHSVRILQYRVSTSDGASPEDQDPFFAASLESLIAREICAQADSQTTFRFSITGYDSKRPLALLRVLNWDTRLWTQSVGPGAETELQTARWQSVLKVAFVVETAAIKTLLDRWTADNRNLETLEFLDDECAQLRDILQRSNAILAPGSNEFQGMQIGFLRLAR